MAKKTSDVQILGLFVLEKSLSDTPRVPKKPLDHSGDPRASVSSTLTPTR